MDEGRRLATVGADQVQQQGAGVVRAHQALQAAYFLDRHPGRDQLRRGDSEYLTALLNGGRFARLRGPVFVKNIDATQPMAIRVHVGSERSRKRAPGKIAALPLDDRFVEEGAWPVRKVTHTAVPEHGSLPVDTLRVRNACFLEIAHKAVEQRLINRSRSDIGLVSVVQETRQRVLDSFRR